MSQSIRQGRTGYELRRPGLISPVLCLILSADIPCRAFAPRRREIIQYAAVMNWKIFCNIFKPRYRGWDGIVRGEDARRLEAAMKRNETRKVSKAEYDRAMAVFNSVKRPDA